MQMQRYLTWTNKAGYHGSNGKIAPALSLGFAAGGKIVRDYLLVLMDLWLQCKEQNR